MMLRPLNNYYLSLIINDLNKMSNKKEEVKVEPAKIRDKSNDRTINPQ